MNNPQHNNVTRPVALSGDLIVLKRKTGGYSVYGPYQDSDDIDAMVAYFDRAFGNTLVAIVSLGRDSKLSFREGQGLADYHERQAQKSRRARPRKPHLPYAD